MVTKEKVVEPILINLTRKQIVRLYKKKDVSFVRRGDLFVIRHKVDNRLVRAEALLKKVKERVAELKNA